MPTLRSIVFAVAVVPALTFTAACSDSKGDDAKNSGPISSSSRADNPSGGGGTGKAATNEQLQKAMLLPADLGGSWAADPEGVGGDAKMTLLKEECMPVVGLFSPLSGAVQPDGKAEAGFTNDASAVAMTVRLTSFKNAEKVLADAQSALDECRLITGKDADGGSISLTVTTAAAPKLGDQSVAFAANISDGSDSVHMSVTAVRAGNTVETMVTTSADGAAAPADETLLKKQVEKIAQIG